MQEQQSAASTPTEEVSQKSPQADDDTAGLPPPPPLASVSASASPPGGGALTASSASSHQNSYTTPLDAAESASAPALDGSAKASSPVAGGEASAAANGSSSSGAMTSSTSIPPFPNPYMIDPHHPAAFPYPYMGYYPPPSGFPNGQSSGFNQASPLNYQYPYFTGPNGAQIKPESIGRHPYLPFYYPHPAMPHPQSMAQFYNPSEAAAAAAVAQLKYGSPSQQPAVPPQPFAGGPRAPPTRTMMPSTVSADPPARPRTTVNHSNITPVVGGVLSASRASPVPNHVYTFESGVSQDQIDLVYLGIYDDVVTNKRPEALGDMIRVWNDVRKHLYYDCVCKKRKPIKNLKAMIAHANRHSKDADPNASYACEHCGKQYTHGLALQSHQRVHRLHISTSDPPHE